MSETTTTAPAPTEAKIRRDMTMGDIVSHYPETVDAMLSAGLHCIGCSVSYTETLEEGCKSHGMNDDDIDALLAKMNGAVVPTDETGKIIQLTPKAGAKIKELMKAEGKEGFFLRVGFVKGGCSGYSYMMEFEKEKLADDESFDEEGITVIMRPDALDVLRGLKIDYRDGLQGAGFKIVNPNAKRSCGCGSSFA